MKSKDNGSTVVTAELPKIDESKGGESKVTIECLTIEQTEKKIEDLILKVFDQ